MIFPLVARIRALLAVVYNFPLVARIRALLAVVYMRPHGAPDVARGPRGGRATPRSDFEKIDFFDFL